MSTFKDECTFEKRKNEAEKILIKYPDRIPIICEKNKKSNIDVIDKRKFLVPRDLTMGQFMFVLRKKMVIKSDQAIFLFVNNMIPPVGAMIGNIYEENKDLDNFLYVFYASESTFGNNN